MVRARNAAAQRGYSLLTVLVLLTLLGIAVSGLLFFITQSTQTTGAMIERRRTFYACDGMSRQLIGFTQAYLATNTREDVDEVDLRNKLIERLPTIIPEGFRVDTSTAGGGLVVPVRALPNPVPVETITSGPFAGIQAKLQTIDIALQATKSVTGAVCRTEQSISLGKIALFQFFVFADLPLLDIAPRANDEQVFLRGRVHTNGRVCLGAGISRDRRTVRLDSRVTAVDAIKHASDNRMCLGSFFENAAIISAREPGEQVLGERDRLLDENKFDELTERRDSGCLPAECGGGWRSFSVATWGGRVQDREHSVPELTLPVSPPAIFAPHGYTADGRTTDQSMSIGNRRPNTRFLIEPETDNDPAGFGENKMARRAQIRILDGVWYIKDPGASAANDDDDGPWPGIPVWSDHPGSFTLNANFTAEGVDRVDTAPRPIGQTDIRLALEDSTDTRLANAKWSRRAALRAPPTPRRFSYYAYVDEAQADDDSDNILAPNGPGLQYGRVQPRFSNGDGGTVARPDHDPPAVISYGTITNVELQSAQTYALPAVHSLIDEIGPRKRFGRGASDAGFCGDVSDFGSHDSVLLAATLMPTRGVSESGALIFEPFPLQSAPLPSNGSRVDYPSGAPNPTFQAGAACASDSEREVRRRARIALLEATRSGFRDTNFRPGEAFDDGQGDLLPLNFDLHALQEALADRTPGELGSYFCSGCLWPSFDGTIFVSNSWRGSMLSRSRDLNTTAAAAPSPRVNDDAIALTPAAGLRQPGAQRAMSQSTASLPFPLCSGDLAGERFLEADEGSGAAFTFPYEGNADDDYARMIAIGPPAPAPAPTPRETTFRIQPCSGHAIKTPGPVAAVRPSVVRLINGRALNFNASKCGPSRNQPCLPRLSERAEGNLDAGLNVITNLPAYVVGDVNLTSETVNIQTGRKADDWIPFMIGADTVTTLSNSWSDEASRWSSDGFGVPAAASTRYNFLLLSGITSSGRFSGSVDRDGRIEAINSSSGGLTGVMRLMEDWQTSEAVHSFRGSIVIGWNPVYTKWRVPNASFTTFRPPVTRDWQFDQHLNATVNQPPDSPVFDVSAIRSWRRE